jgi:hypothetical protein
LRREHAGAQGFPLVQHGQDVPVVRVDHHRMAVQSGVPGERPPVVGDYLVHARRFPGFRVDGGGAAHVQVVERLDILQL